MDKEELETSEYGDDAILESNQDIVDNLNILNENIKTYSRDWTVETISNQVEQGNIDLNPRFQRRNAWTDEKRSRLIESLILKLPVPGIVLAESHEEKNKFIVLDGKQRLLTIMGFFDPEKYHYWNTPKIRGLHLKTEINNNTWKDLSNNPDLSDLKRAIENADIRCTVVFNQSSDDILYEIFYRLNSGAAPLSMQELRHSLKKGEFSNFLIDETNKLSPIHRVLNIKEPDKRLIDSEIILKYIANKLFISQYKGNLKKFLDKALTDLNRDWDKYKDTVTELYKKFNSGIEILEDILGPHRIGKYFEANRFNRNIMDVQIFFASELTKKDLTPQKIDRFKSEFSKLSLPESEFRISLSSQTTSSQNFKNRYVTFGNMFDTIFNKSITPKFN